MSTRGKQDFLFGDDQTPTTAASPAVLPIRAKGPSSSATGAARAINSEDRPPKSNASVSDGVVQFNASSTVPDSPLPKASQLSIRVKPGQATLDKQTPVLKQASLLPDEYISATRSQIEETAPAHKEKSGGYRQGPARSANNSEEETKSAHQNVVDRKPGYSRLGMASPTS